MFVTKPKTNPEADYIIVNNCSYDIAVQLDGDGQHNPAYIRALLHPILKGKADFVIGSRFLMEEGFKSSQIKQLGIRFLSTLIYICCHTRIKDVTSGFRAVNKKGGINQNESFFENYISYSYCFLFYKRLCFAEKKTLLLKYTLLWILAGIVMTLVVIFPGIIVGFTRLLGIETVTNCLFAMCIFFVILILMSITAIASKINEVEGCRQ